MSTDNKKETGPIKAIAENVNDAVEKAAENVAEAVGKAAEALGATVPTSKEGLRTLAAMNEAGGVTGAGSSEPAVADTSDADPGTPFKDAAEGAAAAVGEAVEGLAEKLDVSKEGLRTLAAMNEAGGVTGAGSTQPVVLPEDAE